MRHNKYNAVKRLDPEWRKSESKRAHGWNKRNRDRKNANNRTYRRNNIDKARVANNKWRSANLEWIREYERARRNPERAREYERRRREKNPERTKLRLAFLATNYKDASKINRRAKLSNHDDRVTSAELAAIRMKYAGVCPNCGEHAKLEFDHVVSVKRGGRHIAGNIQMLCRSCNMDKGTKEPVIWAWTNKRRRFHG